MADNFYNFKLESKMTGDDAAENVAAARFVLSTVEGSIPLDRAMGINMDFLGRTAETARAGYVAEVAEKIPALVPEARLKSVTWEADEKGNAAPEVTIKNAEQ